MTENPAPGHGGAGERVSPETAARLAGLSAREAVGELDGDFAEAMPVVVPAQFPGPIAERFFWSNAAIAGIQGPVGSGKTTTLLQSRFRRACQMPRSSVDGMRRYKLVAVRETYRD